MKSFPRFFLIFLLAFFTLGNRGCVTPNVIVLPEGPKAVALDKTKDEQIAQQAAQIKAKDDVNASNQATAAKAASSVKGMLKVRDYLPAGLPSDAIKAEGDLALTRLPPDDPAETVRALERVVLIVTGQRDEAQKRYEQADAQTKAERAAKEAKDVEISKRDQDIKARDGEISKLAVDAKTEKAAHLKDVQSTISRLEKERDEAEQKSIMFWLGIGAIVLVVGGIVLIAVSSGQMIVQGSILSVGGGLVILLRLGYLSLIAAPWFPYVAGIVAAIILGAIIWAIWHMWVKHKLDEKKTQAIQDLRDESAAKGDTKAIDALDQHLEYRMGQDGSFWQKQQSKTEVALGLVDPKGEAALATPTPAISPTEPPKS